MKPARGDPSAARRRRWWLAPAIVAAGVLPFVVLEAGLRVADYGYSTAFFVPVPGRSALASNEKFGWRFFPPAIARIPITTLIPPHRERGEYRIFVLGDSAAMGIPEPAFSFGRILKAMLEDRHPDTKFTMVNTAMTAINSHVMRTIAAGAAELEPSLFIVLAGNNEVVGPYGPASVLAGYSPSLELIRAGIWFRSTRTAQLMERGAERFEASPLPVEWGGMAMFAGNRVERGDPRLENVYRNFRANLEAIGDLGKHAGARVILSTVPVNLRDNAPFASARRDGRDSGFERLYRSGMQAQARGDWSAAAALFFEARKRDAEFAELRYRLGRCLLELHRDAEAFGELSDARDLDALRFRADSAINRMIREAAAQAGALLADPEREWGAPGDDLFYEHVHLNFAGNYRLAAGLLPLVEAGLPAALRQQRAQHGVLSSDAAAQALAYTEWDRDRAAMEMMTMTLEAPFTAQPGFAEKRAGTEAALAAMREKWASPARLAGVRDHLSVYEYALARDPADLELRQLLAELLSRAGAHAQAAAQYRVLIGYVPGVARWHANLAHEASELAQTQEARTEAAAALRLDPHFAPAQFTMGQILEREGDLAEAAQWYVASLRNTPDLADAQLRLAVLAGKQGQYREAVNRYAEFLKLSPGSAEVESNMGVLLVKLGETERALPHYRAALRIRPDFAEAANNLGAALERLGRPQESVAWFELAIRLRPDLAQARVHLNEVRRQLAHPPGL